MISAETNTNKTKTSPKGKSPAKPTAILLNGRVAHNQMSVIGFTREGFKLNDVQEMLSVSRLFSSSGIVERITGKSIRTIQRKAKDASVDRLNSQQSAVAFQYAQVLEHATAVFGTQKLAEEWLERPCKYLDNNVPLELIDNSLGFQLVEEYLERLELGVYQ